MERLQLSSGQLHLRASRYQYDYKSMERLQRISSQMHIRARNQFDSTGQLIVKCPLTNLKNRKDCRVLVKSSKTSVPIMGSKGEGSLLTRDITYGMSPLAAVILGIANVVLWIVKTVANVVLWIVKTALIISLIILILEFVLGLTNKICDYLVVLYTMPFKKGDIITILGENDELTGIVENLGFRTCTLNTLEAFQIIVPTRTLVTRIVRKLNGEESHLKWDFCVPLSVMNYRNCVEKLKVALNEIPTVKRGSPEVLATGFNFQTPMKMQMKIVVTCLVKIENLEEYYLTKDKVFSSVLSVFFEVGRHSKLTF